MNIIHRDIRPCQSRCLARGAKVEIADLGLAKRLLMPTAGSEDINASVRREQLTMRRGESLVQGTPAYLAPEMALTPEDVDELALISCSLGVTAYQLLTGQLPFDAKDPMQSHDDARYPGAAATAQHRFRTFRRVCRPLF